MRRRELFALALSAAAVLPFVSHAQKANRTWRIGYLDAALERARRPMFEVFRQRMEHLGYVEGHNIAYDFRFAEGQISRLPELVRQLIASDPDVMFVATTPAAVAAKAATSAIPIVMVAIADPVGGGLVQSLNRPGGNVTGITNIVAELTGKRLEFLKEIVPGASRVAVLVNPDDPNATGQLENARTAADSLGIELRPVLEIRAADDLEPAFATALREGAGAAIRMVDPLSTSLAKPTAEAAARHRLPVIYAFRQNVTAGGLISYGTDLPAQFGQAADFVDKILKGAKPADLPVERPTRFELVINMIAAKALDLTIPSSILARADEVID